ncbi:MAG TPA: DNA-formamidopyrimidine glycosylase family protein [Micrococcaceae bacterium]
MPELPEVAALASYLERTLSGLTADALELGSFAVLKTADPPHTELPGRSLARVGRYGKFISLDFSTAGAGPYFLLFHLAKAGWVRDVESPSSAPLKPGGYTVARIRLHGPDGPRALDLTEAGTRRSVALYIVRNPADVPAVAALGPDPLEPAFTPEVFAGILGGQSGRIKGVLRSQGLIAGIGNAYSDEILHAARLSPFAPSSRLDPEAVAVLYAALRQVLREAVAEREGHPARELKDAKRTSMRVHGRTGLPCPVCGELIREVSYADTSLQYCPHCQTGGKILADRRTSRFLK